jgi:hypothetical protein
VEKKIIDSPRVFSLRNIMEDSTTAKETKENYFFKGLLFRKLKLNKTMEQG